MARDREIRVGPAQQPGRVKVSALAPGRLTLSVSYKGERSATVVLTAVQVRQLREALEEFEPLVGTAEANETNLKLAA